MRVEIVDIDKSDSSYWRRESLIGKKGTFATVYSLAAGDPWPEGFDGGDFYFDNGSNRFHFHKVKTKPIYDA